MMAETDTPVKTKHQPRTRQHAGGEHRSTCSCGWEGDFWMSKGYADREGMGHRIEARSEDQ